MAGQNRERVVPRVRNAPGQHLEDHRAHAVDVRARVHHCRGQLLGRGVVNGPDELVRPGEARVRGAFPDVRQPEVDQLVDPFARRELVRHHVGRLQVAMDDADAVRQLERAAERRDDAADVLDRHLSGRSQFVLEAASIEQLHDQERMAVRLDVEVENRDDVGMAEPRRGPALTHEAFAGSGYARQAVAEDDLDRDLVAEQRPPCPIHRSHPAFGERSEDFVAAVEDLPGREHGPIQPQLDASG